MHRTSLRSTSIALIALFAAACASKSQGPAATAAHEPAPPPNVAAPMAQPGQAYGQGLIDAPSAELDAAERQIAAALGEVKNDARDEGEGAPKATPGVVPPPAPQKRPERGPGGARDGCTTACGALASMARAATRLCALTGEGDARCASARDRLRAAEGRVRAACPSCPAP